MNDWSMLKKLIWLHAIRGGGSGGTVTIVTGTTPLTLDNALAKSIRSLVQYGKVTTSGGDTYCNNGKLVAVDDELPSGYTRITGIKFDGDFYYDTGEVLNGDDVVTMTLANTASTGQNVFGSYNGTSAVAKNFSLFIYGGGSNSNSYFRYGEQLLRPKFGSNEHTITLGGNGTTGFTTDSTATPETFTTVASAYIGMLPNSSSAAYTGSIIGEITVGTRLKWIPCERESDGAIGYYEAVNGTFLEPVGTGTPVAGSYATSHLNVLTIVGTAEVLTVGEQTASVANLFAVDNIKDEQNIINGTVTHRCEALISDGTTPSGRYIGTVGEGNIIVKVRETGYEGDVATFEADRAEPLNGLTVNVNPIQDLHGYDSPWPAGGGKNKIPFPFADSSGTYNGVNFTVGNDSKITASGTTTGGVNFFLARNFAVASGTYTVSITNSPVGMNLVVYDSANRVVLTSVSSSGKYGTFSVSSDTTVNVYFSTGTTGATVNISAYVQLEIGSTPSAWTPYSNICPISGRTSATIYRSGADTSNPTTYTITLGDTVYGGTLDVTGGKMVVDRAIVDLGTLEYFYVSSGSVNAFRSNIGALPVTDNNQYGITSIYPFAGTRFTANMPNQSWMIDSQGRLFIRDDRYTDISSFKTYLSGQTIVYGLATPLEITLTPTQIETLIGMNNIWSDAGAVKAYVADTELIEHVTAQPLRTAEGSNTVSVTSAVAPVQLEVKYVRGE